MRIACSFEPAILIYFYRGVISQPLYFGLQNQPGNRIADSTPGNDTDKTRNNETVIDYIFPNLRRSRPVKTNTGQIRRIGWQEKISIAS